MKFFLSILILGTIIGVPDDPDDFDDVFEFTGLADDEDSSDCDSETETDNVCILDQSKPDIKKNMFVKILALYIQDSRLRRGITFCIFFVDVY